MSYFSVVESHNLPLWRCYTPPTSFGASINAMVSKSLTNGGFYVESTSLDVLNQTVTSVASLSVNIDRKHDAVFSFLFKASVPELQTQVFLKSTTLPGESPKSGDRYLALDRSSTPGYLMTTELRLDEAIALTKRFAAASTAMAVANVAPAPVWGASHEIV